MDAVPSIVAKKLQALIVQPQAYKQLLRCRGQDAQELLDLFQWLLDQPDLDEQLSKHLIVLVQRILVKTGLYPVCSELKDEIEDVTQAGGGAHTDIYRGKFQGERLCIRVMRVFETMDKELVLKQFWKEAILWRPLCHPNILPIYGLYQFQDRPCIVAPWMENDTVTKYLKHNPAAPRLPLAVGVARGLYYLHTRGVIHGDLKGSNILVDDEGIARVADFGISSISDPQIFTLTSHSGAASKGGTVRWQAPELFDMQNDIEVKNNKASDVYAWACVCYEIFTGRLPLDHIANDATVLYSVKMGVRPSRPPYSSSPWDSWGLTEDIWLMMEDCWNVEPNDRPTIGSVLHHLHSDETYSGNDYEAQYSPTHFCAIMRDALSHSRVISTRVLDDLISNNSLFTGMQSQGDQVTVGHAELSTPPDPEISQRNEHPGPGLSWLEPVPLQRTHSQDPPYPHTPGFDYYPKEYGTNNLARRPEDWRPDYRRTLIPRPRRPRSDVEEYKDPIKRVVHPTLSYNSSEPCVSYDLRFFPHPDSLIFPPLGRPYNHIDFAQLATNPPADRMRLFHPALPWYIDIVQSQANGIMVEDVFMQVFLELQLQITARHYDNDRLGSKTRESIARAFVNRTRDSEEEREKGIKRVDYFEDRVIFVGLVRTRDGLWEMKTKEYSA